MQHTQINIELYKRMNKNTQNSHNGGQGKITKIIWKKDVSIIKIKKFSVNAIIDCDTIMKYKQRIKQYQRIFIVLQVIL
ncbi:unnamed protein product [Paramecium primaurelia]|uniref:Uncharacterized protein n=1 Tax=Paramecium primaurelia TaxID=5886 RepID=A0A8S1PCL5_PARPR|nr:unnamed protein product [Paramecium primaurelia]